MTEEKKGSLESAKRRAIQGLTDYIDKMNARITRKLTGSTNFIVDRFTMGTAREQAHENAETLDQKQKEEEDERKRLEQAYINRLMLPRRPDR